MTLTKRSYTRFDDDSHSILEDNGRMADDILDFFITKE
jgi:hypothetical protein